MARDANDTTPPHITALIDQGAAEQAEHDRPPDGVVLQVRLRRVQVGDDVGLVASFVTNVDSPREMAAALVTLQAVCDEYQRDLTEVLRDLAGQGLAGQGLAGLAEAVDILRILKEHYRAGHHRTNTDQP